MPRIEFIIPENPSRPFSLPMTDGFSALIGREEDCDIFLPLSSISGHHAVVERVSGGMKLRDIGSTNGLLIDGERVDQVVLSPSCRVMIGEAALVYSETDEERALFDSEKAQSQPLFSSPAKDPWAEDASPQDVDEDSFPSALIPLVQVEEQKPSYVPMVLYAIFIFALAVVAGMTYQHYKKTGDLLPLIWMGREPLSEKSQESVDKTE